jgi:hypothetical protein
MSIQFGADGMPIVVPEEPKPAAVVADNDDDKSDSDEPPPPPSGTLFFFFCFVASLSLFSYCCTIETDEIFVIIYDV